jgi:hypothetical protein
MEVILDDIHSALDETRRLRLAAEILRSGLPARWEIDSQAGEALDEIIQKIGEAEIDALVAHGLNRQFLIIKPLDLTRMSAKEELEKIAEAVQVLKSFGLLLPVID